MWINLGRVLMLFVWGCLLFNLIQPFPKPTRFFLDAALVFMAAMHFFQVLLLKATLTKDEPRFTFAFEIRMFLFGVFELIAWQKKLRRH